MRALHVPAAGEQPQLGELLTPEPTEGTVLIRVRAAGALSRGDVEELAAFRTRAPGLRYAHPTIEHFTPLFVTLGASADPTAPVTTAIDGFAWGLAKRSFQAA